MTSPQKPHARMPVINYGSVIAHYQLSDLAGILERLGRARNSVLLEEEPLVPLHSSHVKHTFDRGLNNN